MNANEYQRLADRTLIDGPDAEYTPTDIMIVWNALGLAGEAGEVADTIKKAVFHQHGLDRDELIKELGDVLWYVAALCSKLNVPLSEVMDRNIAKLIMRYPNGYSSTDSQVRVDIEPTPGAMAICSQCDEVIEWGGAFWRHLGPAQPRHPALPKGSNE